MSLSSTAVPRSVTLYAVPSGGTAGDSNTVVKAKTVAANDYLDVDVPVLAAGGFLQALADAATSVTCTWLSGAYFS